jgi:arabinose-5-phosphate isomerase
MTASQCGSVVIVDGEKKLLGIFTDGDFRRIMSKNDGESVLLQPVGDVMTRNPLYATDTMFAAELLKVFSEKHIDDLPVVDASGKVVGIVDIQDLPKMKVL